MDELSNTSGVQRIVFDNRAIDANGITPLPLDTNHYTVLRSITSAADISYPICSKTYGWYAVHENWSGARIVNKSGVTITVDYVYTSNIV